MLSDEDESILDSTRKPTAVANRSERASWSD
jgi:hypothetical protein